MSRFVLYHDEDSQDQDLEAALVAFGLDVRRSGVEGMNGTPDEQQLEFAASNGWVLYTSNLRDFDRLHRVFMEAGLNHAGIIFHARQRFSVGEQARRIVRIWSALSAEEMVNRIESLRPMGREAGVGRRANFCPFGRPNTAQRPPQSAV